MAITVELIPEIEKRLIAKTNAQDVTEEAFLQAAIENLLDTQPKIYKIGTALVVESKPIINLENWSEQERETTVD